ncbi:hypothetical protein BN946_scf184794.g10 [Trametes cinnabarina]|uniref:Cytochrome P450 n=1 Tax=Pycnoporus cinnabarinus TaxID=5643 RepID=A0A060SRW9_PYCCI|nr:hypothetical protein BN946_scf184794.g10 [Trametes cinnabarina]
MTTVMSAGIPSIWVPFSLAVAVLVLSWCLRNVRTRHRLPPGLKPLPLINTALDMPTKDLGRRFRDLTAKDGGIVYLDVLRQPMVILLFYSNAITSYHLTQLRRTHRLLQNLAAYPDGLFSHVQHYFGAMIMGIIYGLEIADNDDKYLKIARKVMRIFIEFIVPGRYLVESLPILRYVPSWFPRAGFKRRAAEWRKDEQALRNVPFDAVKENSTLSTVMAFFLAMVNCPDVQRKAQAELETVVGPNRLPTFEDRESLPIGFMWDFAPEGYTPRWLTQRRPFHQLLYPNAVKSYRPTQLRQTHRLLHKLVTTPDDLPFHVPHYFGVTIMDIVYRLEIAEDDDNYLKIARKAMDIFIESTVPGRYLVESVPIGPPIIGGEP